MLNTQQRTHLINTPRFSTVTHTAHTHTRGRCENAVNEDAVQLPILADTSADPIVAEATS